MTLQSLDKMAQVSQSRLKMSQTSVGNSIWLAIDDFDVNDLNPRDVLGKQPADIVIRFH